jgi:hypothetical protein
MSTHHHWVLEPVPVAAQVEIREQLENVLQSVPFRTSRQCQDLFRYIVEHSLAGSDDSLRERVIGIEVFGRAPDYDTAEDPVVRLRAADIRKRLAQYYQAGKSAAGDWKIDIPTGSYKAQFHRVEGSVSQIAIAKEAQPRPEPLPSPPENTSVPKKQAHKRRMFWVSALLVACIAVVLVALALHRSVSVPPSAFDLFWEPVLNNSSPVLVCTGSNPVYLLSQSAVSRYRTAHSQGHDAVPNLQTLVPPEELKNFKVGDFRPMKDTYLTVGDTSAAVQVSSLLTSRHHAFDLRFGSDLSFGDLRQGSAVLIGAFNNSWTLNMTGNLRFVFESGNTPEMHVQDKFDRSHAWGPKLSNEKVVEDYAIVSRILDSKTGRVLVTIAGLYHSGTWAAGEFATNPQLITEFVKHAPKDWNKKNLQVVLHTDVVNDIPGSPTVVAVYYW